MIHSESINELGAALAKAQGQIEGAKKDSNNPFFKSKYADLSSVWEACRQALSSNGLSIIQSPEESESGIAIETMILHSSGQWVKGRYTMPVSKLDAQAVGSAITYARRYALASIVGIAPEDDDDGNQAVKSVTNNKNVDDAQKKELDPSKKSVWDNAKAAFIRDGNLKAVLERYTITEENQLKLIDECKKEDIPQ